MNKDLVTSHTTGTPHEKRVTERFKMISVVDNRKMSNWDLEWDWRDADEAQGMTLFS